MLEEQRIAKRLKIFNGLVKALHQASVLWTYSDFGTAKTTALFAISKRSKASVTVWVNLADKVSRFDRVALAIYDAIAPYRRGGDVRSVIEEQPSEVFRVLAEVEGNPLLIIDNYAGFVFPPSVIIPSSF